MRQARVVAQAKINLFLRVLAREATGYHQLETLFCRLDLGDEVTVRLADGARSLDCTGPTLPAGGLGPVEQNLAWRAAIAYTEATAWRTGFAIEIEKRIPVGGGLGGGSADAGAVLRTLNALAPVPMRDHDLLRLAAGLGADVPFLTQCASPLALAWGRGDRLLALPPLPARPCLLVTFREGVATADAYRWLAESPAEPSASVAYSLDWLREWSHVDVMAYNEFERVVLPRHPLLRAVFEGLRQPALREALPLVRMSGSGATIFALQPTAGPEGGVAGLDDLAFGLDLTAWGSDAVALLDTQTAAHVESVRLDD